MDRQELKRKLWTLWVALAGLSVVCSAVALFILEPIAWGIHIFAWVVFIFALVEGDTDDYLP